MSHLTNRLKSGAVIAAAAVFALAACQDRTPSAASAPPASSGEYPNPSDASTTSSSNPGTEVTAKDPGKGTAGGASGTVGSGAGVSSGDKVETRK